MKKMLMILSLIVLTSNLLAQNNTTFLYLLMGNTEGPNTKHKLFLENEDKNKNSSLLKILWRLENDNLISVDTLNFNWKEPNPLRELIHFPKQKWFYIEEKPAIAKISYMDSIFGTKPLISVLDYNGNDFILRKYDANIDTSFIQGTPYKALIHKDSIAILHHDIDIKIKNTKRYGVDLNLNRYKIMPNDFLKIIDCGESGFQDGTNWSFSFDKNGTLRLGMRINSNSLIDNPESLIQVPDSLKMYKKGSAFNILLNWRESKYLVGFLTPKTDKYKILIFNKEDKIWTTEYLPGINTNISIYNDFLYGTKIEWVGNKNDVDTLENSTNLKYIQRYSSKYAPRPLLQGHTGILFIYHIPTKKFTLWDTKDRDSELLAIMEGWIYYRVYDEVRRVLLNEVTNTIEWKKEELLVKDKDIIPHVHHIFWAKKSRLIAEWKTPKPEKN